MEILKEAMYFVILLTSLPAGMFLSYICKDELYNGKKYFGAFLYASAFLLIASLLFYRNLIIILSIIYSFLMIGTIFLKSKKIKK